MELDMMLTTLEVLRYLAATVVLLLAGFIFAIGVVRIWFMDPREYQEARKITGGYKHLIHGTVPDQYRNETLKTAQGMSVKERKGYPRRLRRESRVSDSALVHWR